MNRIKSSGAQKAMPGWARGAVLCLTVCVTSLVLSTSVLAQATYQYTGNNFNLFSCGGNSDGVSWTLCSTAGPNANTSYTATDHVTATLTLAAALPPNLPITDVSGYAGFGLVMSDGQQTLNWVNYSSGAYAEVATDASGQIVQWRFGLYVGYPTNAFVFTENKATSVFDTGALLGVYPGNQAYNFSMPGTWNSGTPSPAAAVTNLIAMLSNPSLQLTSGQIASLTDKLNNALLSIQQGLNNQAINQLNSFINSVTSSVKTGKMSQTTGNTLITAAQAIIAMLQT